MDEYRIKEQLLGVLKPRTVTGTFQPNRQTLTEPMEGDSSVMYGFCQGCGLTMEITAKGRDILQTEFGISISESLKETYLHFMRCMFCHDRFRDLLVKTIPS